MPYSRLQYNGDNQYTYKDKRNLLLTQETIEKINNITTGGIDAVVETDPTYQTKTFAELAALNDKDAIVEELNQAPQSYAYALAVDERLYNTGAAEAVIYDNGEIRFVNGYTFVYDVYEYYWEYQSTK